MATYRLKGSRFVRKYTAAAQTPVYSAAADAETISASLCDVPWTEVGSARAAVLPAHNSAALDSNVDARDYFDAANFCSGHKSGMHIAHANVACYRIVLPDSAVGLTLSSITARITGDPYLRDGARVAVNTNSTGDIPMTCTECRTGLGYVDEVAKRTTSSDGSTWYGATEDATITPSSALVLQKYLYVFVTLSSPAYSRDGWLEGAAIARNDFSVVLSDACADLDADTLNDCSSAAIEFVVARGGAYPRVDGWEACARYAAALHDGSPVPELHTASAARALHIFTSSDAVQDVGDVLGLYASPTFKTGASSTGSIQVVLCTGGTYVGGLADLYRDGSTKLTFAADSGVTIDDCYNLPGWNAVADGSLRRVMFAVAPFAHTVNGSTTYYSRIVLWAVTDAAILPLLALDRTGTTVKVVKWDESRYTADGSPGGDLSLITTKSTVKVEDGQIVNYVSANIASVSVDDSSISVGGVGSVEFDGDVYGLAQDFKNLGGAFWVYGRLRSVGGKTCRNVAHCMLVGGKLTVDVPRWDAAVTPDTYSRFHVSLPNSGNTLLLSGDFSALGNTAVSKFASISITNGNLGQQGKLDYVADAVAWMSGNAVIAVTPNLTAPGVDSSDVPAAPASNDVASAGLRATYAKFFMGGTRSVRMPTGARVGASFRVQYATRSVPVDGAATSVPFWTLATTCAVVPFSAPLDVRATAVRLDWSALSGVTEGAFFAVWIRAGEYLDEISDDDVSDPSLYVASCSAVGKWKLVGRVDPTGTTATLQLPEPLTGMVGTLLLTAYSPQDEFNPAAGMTVPRGVEQSALPVDPIEGHVATAGTGWKPDITLVA